MKTKNPKTTSFEETCNNKGYNPETVIPDMSCYPEKHRAALEAAAKLILVLDDMREGKDPDWNTMAKKWFPWWDMEVDENNPSGFRFYGADCDYSHSYSAGGSRFALHNEDDVRHAVKHFEPLYRALMVIKK